MTEHAKILDEYVHNAYFIYSKTLSEEKWGNRDVALAYLKKYYLPAPQYLNLWRHTQSSIFQNEGIGLPKMVFKDEFSLLAIRGGLLFEREDFEKLKNCMKELSDKSLIIVQNDFGGAVKKPLLRMKYPATITWDELMSGNVISTVLFEMFANEYFVFSESGNWGKYSANDYEHPLDIVGFKADLSYVFREQFKQSKDECEEISEWLPQEYRNLVS